MIFTIFTLCMMCLPLIGGYFVYWERWFIIAASLWTMALMLNGYKHLIQTKNDIVRGDP
jgi:hypothetical protein